MEEIEEYLSRTKSAVNKLYEAYNSYYDLMRIPKRPIFSFWGELESEENRITYSKWQIENKEALEERSKKDNEFAFEFFARSTLCGSILQFAFNGIKIFSNNDFVPDDFKKIIKPGSNSAKFCIGRLIDNIPLGLIVYAGRNQAMHFDETKLKDPSRTVFYKLANWYSPSFNKWYVNSFYDLNDKNVIHYAENILYKLGWLDYNLYEKDMIEMFKR